MYTCKYIITLRNISQEFWLKKLHYTRNYFLEKIEQNELMFRKHEKVFATLNYTEHFLISISALPFGLVFLQELRLQQLD